jgi:tetraacyldisaccharide 4'-kinase
LFATCAFSRSDPPILAGADPRRQHYLALVRGQARGVWPALQRLGLCLASVPYGIAVRLRNAGFDHGWLKCERVEVPVVSVGNLTVGGTGKTPCVEHVADFYRRRDLLVCILSRGYGGAAGGNDEARVLEEHLPDVPHLQGADRVRWARAAIEELESEILVLDDGFQHRRLARDLDVVLLDATDPWGGEALLPRGLLREPPSSLRRAHAIVLTRCDQATPEALARLRERVGRLAPGVPVAETTHQPVELLDSEGTTASLDLLRHVPVAAFCGLGNPEGFRRTLTDLGARVASFRAYPDHHAYTREDVEALAGWARELPPEGVLVTTQKDLVKLRVPRLGGRQLWALRIRLHFGAGREALEERLAGILHGRGKA